MRRLLLLGSVALVALVGAVVARWPKEPDRLPVVDWEGW